MLSIKEATESQDLKSKAFSVLKLRVLLKSQIQNLLGKKCPQADTVGQILQIPALWKTAKNYFKPQTSLKKKKKNSLNHVFPFSSLKTPTSHVFPNVLSLSSILLICPSPSLALLSNPITSSHLPLLLSILPHSSISDLGLSRLFLPSPRILLDQNHLS